MHIENPKLMVYAMRRAALVTLTVCIVLLLLPTTPVLAAHSTRILIPVVQIDQPVISVPLRNFGGGLITWDVSQLGARAGHFEGTAWFGESGNIVVGMHSEFVDGTDSTGALLYSVNVGDEILVELAGAELHYTISEILVVSEEDVSVLLPTDYEQLTLMTCHIPSYDGSSYAERLIVRALRSG